MLQFNCDWNSITFCVTKFKYNASLQDWKKSQWLAENGPLCICQALAEPLSVSNHLLASTIVSGFGNCILDYGRKYRDKVWSRD